MKTLLVIDDDQNIRKIIKVQLHKTELRILEAENQKTAFDLLGQEEIHVILCDIKMKDTNGFIILKEIKDKYPSLPVIMLTGFIDKKVAERAEELGSFAFITKPVRREKLLESINSALESC
ncbi:MAG: response regulator [Spirochaetales bacterium]|nr:response regulator [Spirochaetales bacterium]